MVPPQPHLNIKNKIRHQQPLKAAKPPGPNSQQLLTYRVPFSFLRLSPFNPSTLQFNPPTRPVHPNKNLYYHSMDSTPTSMDELERSGAKSFFQAAPPLKNSDLISEKLKDFVSRNSGRFYFNLLNLPLKQTLFHFSP
jgi:hypothetical protein